jgi:hypothetical protein
MSYKKYLREIILLKTLTFKYHLPLAPFGWKLTRISQKNAKRVKNRSFDLVIINPCCISTLAHRNQKQILRLWNLQLQRQLERFFKVEETIYALGYSKRCKALQRWSCNSRS